LIKCLKYLENIINCYIDFKLLKYLAKNKTKVIINENNSLNSSSSFDFSSSSFDLNEKIEEMLNYDSCIFNEIIKKNSKKKKDEYGIINDDIIYLSKKLFNLLDKDKDGFISALDAINVIKIIKHYPLIFKHNFDDTIIYLRTSEIKNKIDFDIFFNYFI